MTMMQLARRHESFLGRGDQRGEERREGDDDRRGEEREGSDGRGEERWVTTNLWSVSYKVIVAEVFLTKLLISKHINS